VRLAVIGCGQVVTRGHAPAIMQARSQGQVIDIAGIADISPACLADAGEALGVPPERRFAAASALLESVTADVVLVATPPVDRGGLLASLARRDVTVLCEKPLAPDAATAAEHARLFADRPARLLMCHNYAFFPEFTLMRSLIDQGAIGEPHTVMLSGMGADPWPGAPSFRPGWRADPAWSGGGRLMDTGIHALYLAELLLGSAPERVQAVLSVRPGEETEERCHAWYGFPAGMAVMSFGMGHGPAGAAVLGSGGHLELEYPPGTGDLAVSPVALHVVSAGKVTRSHPVPPRSGLFTAGFYDWVGRVAGGEPPAAHDGRHGAWLVHCVHGAYQAAAAGAAVSLEAGAPARVRA
jgi:predicted dehydrogenase